MITNRERVGKLRNIDIWKLTGIQIIPIVRRGTRHLSEYLQSLEVQHLEAVHTLLCTDRFYFTYGGLDVTSNIATQVWDSNKPLWTQVRLSFIACYA